MVGNATDADMGGSYECMAKSPAGEVKSRSAHMKHSAVPVQQNSAVKGDDVTMEKEEGKDFNGKLNRRQSSRGSFSRQRTRMCWTARPSRSIAK